MAGDTVVRELRPRDAPALTDLYADYPWWEDRTVDRVRAALARTELAVGVEATPGADPDPGAPPVREWDPAPSAPEDGRPDAPTDGGNGDDRTGPADGAGRDGDRPGRDDGRDDDRTDGGDADEGRELVAAARVLTDGVYRERQRECPAPPRARVKRVITRTFNKYRTIA